MRTTLTLDDDILELAGRRAKARGLSLGRMVSDLVRRGLNAPTASREQGGIVVFQLPADSPQVTMEDVRRIEAEGARRTTRFGRMHSPSGKRSLSPEPG